jgi:hypothetical protein
MFAILLGRLIPPGLNLFIPLGGCTLPTVPVSVDSCTQTTSIHPLTQDASTQTKPQLVNAAAQTDEPALTDYVGDLVDIQPVEKSDQGTDSKAPGKYSTRSNSFQSVIPVWINTPTDVEEGVDRFTRRPSKPKGTHTHTHNTNTYAHTHTHTHTQRPSLRPQHCQNLRHQTLLHRKQNLLDTQPVRNVRV